MDFTKSQQNAINVRGKNVLVSAAAGSGKTATLTQRIITLLTDKDNPADITKMLIVTFTRAAAGELRSRICAALTEALAKDPGNYHLSRQLTSLSGAQICTIDSYYNSLVRANFQRLGLPSSFRLDNSGELDILRAKVMDEVIEQNYSDPAFQRMTECLCSAANESLLSDILLKLTQSLRYLPEDIGYVEKCAERFDSEADLPFFDTTHGKACRAALCARLGFMLSKQRGILELIDENPECEPYREASEHEFNAVCAILEYVKSGDYSAARNYIANYSAVTLGKIKKEEATEISEFIKSKHSDFKKNLSAVGDSFLSFREDEIPSLMHATAQFCRELYSVLKQFSEAYTDEKKNLSVLEFSDLRSFALQLLVDADGSPTAAALAEREKYSHIFIDEYQDTDRIQDLIFRTVSNGSNLFLVGDIKQSIYRFRGAEPSLFASYRSEYPLFDPEQPTDEKACSIFMSENFRCSEKIIRFTNTVCPYLFQTSEDNENSGIGYLEEDDLIFSRSGNISEEPVHLVLISKDEEGNECENDENIDMPKNNNADTETDPADVSYVVGEIARLLREGKNVSGEPLRPDDIAVLARSNQDCTLFSNAIANAGIPVVNKDSKSFFHNSEVRLMFCLLSASDNPHRDVPLAGVLRSPIFRFTLSDLVNVRVGRSTLSLYDSVTEYAEDSASDPALAEKCRMAANRINGYREMAESMPVHRFIHALWRDVGALNYAGTDEKTRRCSVTERRRNLRRLYEYARSFEGSAFRSLHDFVVFLNRITESEKEIRSEIETTSGCVNVMTVHGSKGLEFPVVFLVSAQKNFSHSEADSSVVFTTSGDLGIAVKLSDPSGLGSVTTPMWSAVRDRIITTSNEESIRVLYVALTRARDILYVVASANGSDIEKLKKKSSENKQLGGRETVIRAGSWLEWILTALDSGKAAEGSGSYVIETPSASVRGSEISKKESRNFDENRISQLTDEFRRRFSFDYKAPAGASLPSKLSVSHLYPDILTEEEGDDIAATEALLRKAESMEPRVPRFMGGGNDAAERGTATHLFLQFCDFSRLDGTEESARKEAERLTAQRFIPESAAQMVRFDEIAAFSRSDFFRSLSKAREIRRETRFNVFLPAVDFTTNAELKSRLKDEKILVQGVIDLFYTDEDGELVLCDYKTDRLSLAERNDHTLAAGKLTAVHGEQLGYYASALEQILGKRPDRICVYSLHLGAAVDINI
ncbi:MAG: helicase-exonuclease AddAB subunit AddA [Clostridia bacterium]|nr:helicase-exonuclease AddAB subunit AddA [Clostridia bacterium]